MKTYSPTKNMHVNVKTALLVISKTCEQLRYPSVGEQLNKQWKVQKEEYHSTLQRTG